MAQAGQDSEYPGERGKAAVAHVLSRAVFHGANRKLRMVGMIISESCAISPPIGMVSYAASEKLTGITLRRVPESTDERVVTARFSTDFDGFRQGRKTFA